MEFDWGQSNFKPGRGRCTKTQTYANNCPPPPHHPRFRQRSPVPDNTRKCQPPLKTDHAPKTYPSLEAPLDSSLGPRQAVAVPISPRFLDRSPLKLDSPAHILYRYIVAPLVRLFLLPLWSLLPHGTMMYATCSMSPAATLQLAHVG